MALVSARTVEASLTITNHYNSPAADLRPLQRPAVNSVTSNNWSGAVDIDGANVFAGGAGTMITAQWRVPIPRCDRDTNTFFDSSQWVGIDGWRSNDVLQAGSAVNILCGDNIIGHGLVTHDPIDSYSWIEWYPGPEMRTNLIFHIGDTVTSTVLYSPTATSQTLILYNATRNERASFSISPPSGTQLVGNAIEWVMERPLVNNAIAQLPLFNAFFFDDCMAERSSPGAAEPVRYYPGEPATGDAVLVRMLDDSGVSQVFPGIGASGSTPDHYDTIHFGFFQN
ncbi:MAG TPA: G1 family glutamic endopeptidase [Candidatus Elarobacter sp.]|nr:G1 family glutamic endopeptidase [Candidatus Elarobacter sp.]